MKRIKLILTSAIAMMMLASCATVSRVPITGRKQRLSVSDQQILSLSASQYKQYLSSAKKSTNAQNTAMVQRVGQKLANAVETYLNGHGYASEVKNYAWEFNLVQNNSVNAFCMPGGKIVVYEGMLPVTQDEASLAIVLGHEIAHAVAKHSAEQMSKQNNQSILASLGASIVGARLGEMAGYNPNTALTFWQRMSKASSGGGQSGGLQSYLSSHPSDTKRVSDIQKWLPEAMQYYNGAK